MKQILLLSKNIFIDTEWQKKIQQLGYEVFCSNQLLEQILVRHDFTAFMLFKTVIFSESIANEEMAKIIELTTSKVRFFRIDEEKNLNKVHEGPEEHDIPRYLSSSMSLTDLREALMDTHSIKIFATVFP